MISPKIANWFGRGGGNAGLDRRLDFTNESTPLAADALGDLAQDTGKIGRILAYWNICKARDLAWDFAGHLRNLSGISYNTALEIQDAFTGALGRAILTQV